MFYHTALKNKSVTYRGIKETVRFEQQNGIMLKHNLVKLPSADVIVETTLNGNAVSMGVWNENCPIVLPSAELVCQELGSRYKCMGDFACGYGNSVKNFLIGGGQRFVASDYDGKCVTIISRQINKL